MIENMQEIRAKLATRIEDAVHNVQKQIHATHKMYKNVKVNADHALANLHKTSDR